jgi:hypothetical protein
MGRWPGRSNGGSYQAWPLWTDLRKPEPPADCGPITVTCSQELTSSGKLGEQHLGLLQIGSVEAFGEPTVDRREQVISSSPLAAIGP